MSTSTGGPPGRDWTDEDAAETSAMFTWLRAIAFDPASYVVTRDGCSATVSSRLAVQMPEKRDADGTAAVPTRSPTVVSNDPLGESARERLWAHPATVLPLVDGVEVRITPKSPFIERGAPRTAPAQWPPLGTVFAPHFSRADVERAADAVANYDRHSALTSVATVRAALRAVFPHATFEGET
ncbi:MAG: hypothetical protein JWM87_761 [Candidatus Eremiobacteraeota bacterium]|nr:hypothetical protein [Candidatus Eremiobacteraeota bacterium]